MIDKIRDILTGGISRFAKEGKLTEEQVQIRITQGTEHQLDYEVCHNWQPHRKVKFKEIMGVAADIIGIGLLAKQYIGIGITKYATELESSENDISLFAFMHSGKLAIAVYKLQENVKLITLEDFLQEIGIG